MTSQEQALLARAVEALKAARYNLEGSFLTTAVNRTYYAAFYTAQAALLSLGESPKTHTGVLHRFLLHFVQTERLPQAHARTLPQAYQLRLEADYDDGEVIEPEAAQELLDEVDGFVAVMHQLLMEGKAE